MTLYRRRHVLAAVPWTGSWLEFCAAWLEHDIYPMGERQFTYIDATAELFLAVRGTEIHIRGGDYICLTESARFVRYSTGAFLGQYELAA